jgi:chemotaxis methyl-accepting protein methylase/PAS domain-containing protein
VVKSKKPASQKAAIVTKSRRVVSKPYIIGIGASAGGLEALEEFITHMPLTSNIALVIIQHLDPTRKGILPELLQRFTPMKVFTAGNQMKVVAGCIYVIPSNKDLSIFHGSLILHDPVAKRGLRLPIDFFFSSLAEDQRERAVGVILSGMGSDGTIGSRAIKKNAGLVLVQSPESAKFDSMPRSIIDSGLAEIILPPQLMPGHIVTYLKHTPNEEQVELTPIVSNRHLSALDQIVFLLRQCTSNDFSLYKKNTIYRRIERRMGLHQIDTIARYAQFLHENPQEINLLFKELLIGVTSFFRDPEIWELLINEVLPTFLLAHPEGKELRAWVSACSTGEEAYSLAMAFKDMLYEQKPPGQFSLQIFATDLDEDAIIFARQGLYPLKIKTEVTSQRLDRYFTKEEHGYRIHKFIREMVIFAPQNIIMDPPFTKMDILSCRNLLIYLGPELQKKLISLFYYSLTPQGFLFLGNAESIGSFTHLFSPIDNKTHIYKRKDNPALMQEIDFPKRIFPIISLTDIEPGKDWKMSTTIPNLQTLADQLLLQCFAPAAVLTNNEGDIIYISGRTGKYLEPAAGKVNWNIYAMAREGLRHEIIMAMKKAKAQVKPVNVEGLRIETDGGTKIINLTVQAITSPEVLAGTLMIVFQDIATSAKVLSKTPQEGKKALLIELEQLREELHMIRQKMQTSHEELKATNEELQSTNEELQSTNEELTTSKEEMQSLNEELQTVNAELQSKVEDLSWVNNDMINLLNSTEIATIFLDNFLNVRRFTTHVNHLFKLIISDVGRPLSDIVTDLDYPKLHDDSIEVLRSLVYIEKQINSKDGRWFKVRIMPYRTQDNVIDGLVITFTDITDSKTLEAKLRNMRVQDD